MRVAIYTRVSTKGQADEGYSLAAQERILRDYCLANNYEVVKVYSDEGISGKDIRNRPQLSQLLDDAEQKAFDAVLVWKLTRFTRSLADLCVVCDMLEKHNVSFISYSESFDASTPTGRMIRNILGAFAQWEREIIGENVRMALSERATQGKRTCSAVLGYNTGGDDLIINPAEAEVVRCIYSEYLKHKSLRVVADMCNQQGYVGKRGKPFQAESVHKVLTQFIYCGYHSFNRVPIKANHEPIIDVATYNKVQRVLKKQSNGQRKNPLVFLPT